MKRILIDGTTISPIMDGLSQYVLNIVEQFALYYVSKAKFTLLLRFGQCPANYLKFYQESGIVINYLEIPPIGPIRDVVFARYLKKNIKYFDVFYEPSNQYPCSLKNGVYTIHDLIYECYPQQLGRMSWLKRLYLHYNVRRGLKRCRKVIAISNYTKSEILRLHNIKDVEQKIKVVYEGWEHLEKYIDSRVGLVLPIKEYFFYVGSSRGHKNLYNLLCAFEKIMNMTDLKLVIAGNMERLGKKEKHLIAKINKSGINIYCTGWISDEVLRTYFSKATAFVFPSLSEGFGIPVLEAFYYKIPLLCSNNTVFPEVAGDAALYFDPSDPDDIASKLLYFSRSRKNVSPLLAESGIEQIKKFSWKNAASEIFDILYAG